MKKLLALLVLLGCSESPTGVEPISLDMTCKPADQSIRITVAETGKTFEVRGQVCFRQVSEPSTQVVTGDFGINIAIPRTELRTW